MVLVVGDVEAHNLLILAVLLLHVRQLQTTILVAVVGFHRGLAAIENLGGVDVLAVGNGEMDGVALLPPRGIEGAGTQEDVEHVVDTLVLHALLPLVCAVVLLTVLAQMLAAVRIAVEHLIDGVALALACSLAEVERLHLGRTVTEQGVAQHEHVVNALVASRGERRAPGMIAVIFAQHRRHGGCACLYPYKLPVVIEVICEKLARLEGCVLVCALCLGCYSRKGND